MLHQRAQTAQRRLAQNSFCEWRLLAEQASVECRVVRDIDYDHAIQGWDGNGVTQAAGPGNAVYNTSICRPAIFSTCAWNVVNEFNW